MCFFFHFQNLLNTYYIFFKSTRKFKKKTLLALDKLFSEEKEKENMYFIENETKIERLF